MLIYDKIYVTYIIVYHHGHITQSSHGGRTLCILNNVKQTSWITQITTIFY